jgi:hypothetical protein
MDFKQSLPSISMPTPTNLHYLPNTESTASPRALKKIDPLRENESKGLTYFIVHKLRLISITIEAWVCDGLALKKSI